MPQGLFERCFSLWRFPGCVFCPTSGDFSVQYLLIHLNIYFNGFLDDGDSFLDEVPVEHNSFIRHCPALLIQQLFLDFKSRINQYVYFYPPFRVTTQTYFNFLYWVLLFHSVLRVPSVSLYMYYK